MNQPASIFETSVTYASRWRQLLTLTASRTVRQLVLLGAVLLLLIWSSVIWEAKRIKQDQLENFGQDLTHLSEVLEETLVRQLQEMDNALLILRSEYVHDKPNLKHTLGLLRQGPLKNLDVNVLIVDRQGYIEMSERSGSLSKEYVGERESFKHFIKGSPDQLFISDPIIGRLTKRWGMQLVRPILDHDGKFLGTVTIFMPPARLTQFMQSLPVGSDTVMAVSSTQGVLLSRSKDIGKLLGSRQTPAQLAELPRNQNGFITRLSPLDQVERVIAYRWIRRYPLLLTVASPKTRLIAKIAREQRLLMALGVVVSLIVGGSLLLLGVSFRRRERAEALLQREHANLAEAQGIAQLGSWELDLESGRLNWSDEIFRIFEIDQSQFPASYDAFFNAIHPDDREAVNQAYTDSLEKREPYNILHRLRMSDGRIKWVSEHCTSDFDANGKPIRSSGTVQDITERRSAYEETRRSETKFRTLYDSTSDAVMLLNKKGFFDCNKSTLKLFGCATQEEFCTMHPADLSPTRQPCGTDSRELSSHRNATAMDKGSHHFEWVHKRADTGNIFLAEVLLSAMQLDGELVLQAVVRDITERKQTEVELRIAATAFESQEGMLVTDGRGAILRINSAFTEVTGYTAADVVGKNPRIRSSGRHDAAFYTAMWKQIKSTGWWKGEIWNRRKNGEVYPELLTITAVKGDGETVTHYVATMHDITASRAAEEQIRSLAFFDPLTKLPNRRLLQDRLQQALVASARNKRHGALLFLDMDKFKTLNDTMGHDIGDLLLQQVAQRLLSCVREADTVARLGGDEFVVLLEELSENHQEAKTQAASIGDKILTTLNQTYHLGEYAHHSTPSIGATLFRGQQETAEELIKQADLAMYQVKATGRNAMHFFDPAMRASGTDPQKDSR